MSEQEDNETADSTEVDSKNEQEENTSEERETSSEDAQPVPTVKGRALIDTPSRSNVGVDGASDEEFKW